jgi:mono/diheme cytochrome c family protein
MVKLMRVGGLATLAGLLACGGDLDPGEQGRRVYTANCVACHGPNPQLEGVMGPAIAGSSHELLEARVMRAAYPAEYEPKRDTALMQPMPYLKGDLDALAAYLANP